MSASMRTPDIRKENRLMRRVAEFWLASVVLGVGLAMLASPALAAEGPPKQRAGVRQAEASLAGLDPFTHSSDFFPILTWDKLRGWKPPYRDATQGLPSIAECHFTIAGFVNVEDLPACEKLGLAALVPPDEKTAAAGREWLKLSDAEIDARVKSMAERSRTSKAVLGYFVMDEPGVTAFPALAKVVAAVKRHAPGKLAYINLYPSYATVGAPDRSQLGTATYTEYLERFVREVKPQLLSYDNYMVEYSDDLADAKKAAVYFADLLEVRRVSLKYGLPFWNVVSCNQIRPLTTIPSPGNMALQAYTTLAAGGRGISWYKYHQDAYHYAPIDNSGQKTLTWRYLQAINHQVRTLGPAMNRLRSTGVYFTPPALGPSFPVLPGSVVKRVQSKASRRGLSAAEPPLLVGEFIGEDRADYAMIVNLSLQRSANIQLETVKTYKTKQVFSAETGRASPLDETSGLWLPAGHGVLIRLE
jgi:hypothetical protein